MRPRIYLAGPDVFLPDADTVAARKKAICAEHGLVGIFPTDPAPPQDPALPEHRRIYRANEAHLRAADAVIANLTPFRGPSADPGTVYEVGFMRALGRPVFGYTADARQFAARSLVHASGTAVRDADGRWRDGEGMFVESFGLIDNLMIDCGIAESGGAIFVVPAADPWRDTAAFARAAAACAMCLAAR